MTEELKELIRKRMLQQKTDSASPTPCLEHKPIFTEEENHKHFLRVLNDPAAWSPVVTRFDEFGLEAV